MNKNLFLVLLLLLAISCHKKNNHFVDITAFSYTSYPTIDIISQDVNFGIGNGGIILGKELQPGNHHVYWFNANTREKYKSVNQITIPENIDEQFVTLHIYENNLVKIILSDSYPTKIMK